jgi:sortase A
MRPSLDLGPISSSRQAFHIPWVSKLWASLRRFLVRPFFLNIVETSLLTVGGVLCGWYAVAVTAGEIGRRIDLATFSEQSRVMPDVSLWSEGRTRDYLASLSMEISKPVAVLSVPAVHLEVPVYPTPSELHLNRGVGLIDGMALPDRGGNVGIAGHRDGYFRALKDVHKGDLIELRTHKRVHRYRVVGIRIVDAHDGEVLRDTEDPTVTLVTCYPFYFLGHAPRRYIVTAQYQYL